MRAPTNATGFNVELLTPYGWRVCGFGQPHDDRDAANTAMGELKAAAPNREYRVMPALEVRP